MNSCKIIAGNHAHFESLIRNYVKSGYMLAYKDFLKAALEKGNDYVTISLL